MIKSKASSLEKKEVKNISPLTVVMAILLSKTRALYLFSTLVISFLGTSIKVPPKNIVVELNFEWKHSLLFVMNIRPWRIILS